MSRRSLQVYAVAVALFSIVAPAIRGQSPKPRASLGVPTVGTVEFIVDEASRETAVPLCIPVSPNTSMPRLEQPQGGNNIALIQLAVESSEYMDPRYIANSSRPDDLGFWESLCTGSHEFGRNVLQDYRNFYLTDNLIYVGVALAVAAPIANTRADQEIRDWYQRRAGQANSANAAAEGFKAFGYWQYAVPVYLGLALGEHVFPDSPTAQTLGEFGLRSLRALAVGAPTVGVLQYGLGSGRPFTGESHWQPFDHSNGVSGHAFVGAVPFLTAAAMTDRPLLKALLVVGSFGPAWSRIQHDDHYFSQVLLGWAIAYLSVESVNLTENQTRHMRIVPCELPNGVGLGMQIDY